MSPEELFRKIDALACDLVERESTPFLVVLERGEFDRYMDYADASRWFMFMKPGKFPYPSSNIEICGLPIRVERDGSWKGNLVRPYDLVMSQVTAQLCFGGQYG